MRMRVPLGAGWGESGFGREVWPRTGGGASFGCRRAWAFTSTPRWKISMRASLRKTTSTVWPASQAPT